MLFDNYEIVHYHPDMLDDVLGLLRHLWGNDYANNRLYFNWKYSLNPFAEKELGIVALHKNRVVGFRGYFATPWKIKETEKAVILCASDLCVDPAHRRKHLSLMTAKLAMRDYANDYPFFFNFSSNKLSTPLSLKLGYRPLADRGYWNKYSPSGIIKYALSSKLNVKQSNMVIPEGTFGDIEISGNPKPKQMAAIVSRQMNLFKKIYLDRNKAFFIWRFKNYRKKYIFYFFKEQNEIKGYMVVRVLPEKNRGFIIDYEIQDEAAALKLTTFPIKNKHFNVLSICAYSVTMPMAHALLKLGFKQKSILRYIEKKIEGEWPVLIRPVKQNISEQDFYINGLDIRDFQNWSLKEICSDGS
jgi:GNAT superfamily N-acetyltransferase